MFLEEINRDIKVQDYELLNSLCGNSPKEPVPSGKPIQYDGDEANN